MTESQAGSSVTTAAVVIGGIYAYRRLVEGSGQTAPHLGTANAARQLSGVNGAPPAPVSHFLVGYGFLFMVLSGIAQAQPDIGGRLAVLIMVAAIIVQGEQVAADLGFQMGSAPAPAGSTVPGSQGSIVNPSSLPSLQPTPTVGGAVSTHNRKVTF